MGPFRAKLYRAAVLIGGLCATQLILFGPSLMGRKILLPLDVLATPRMYLSPADCVAWGPSLDPILADPVCEVEPDRQFAIAELRAGRLPLWNPHEYCGQPFLAANQTAVLSPFRIPDYFWPAPTVIAWDQLLKTLVAGIGAYLFFRSAVGVRVMPALIGAWLWPICGYYIQWAGHPLSAAADWLPWIFLFTDLALREPRLPWGAGLAIVTAASLLSGHAATSAQVLQADGVFLCWRAIDLHRARRCGSKSTIAGIAAVLGGCLLGAMLSAPQSLPTIAYLRTSYRMTARLAIGSETPTVGIVALPQLVWPDFNGSTRSNEVYIGRSGNLPESASSGCVGLITALVLAPLAFCNRKHRSFVLFAVVLGILGMGQILGLPVLKQLYELFPLNTLRENRLALASGWGIAIMGVIGLDAIEPDMPRRRWFWAAAAVSLALGFWCLIRVFQAPAELTRIVATHPKAWGNQVSQSFAETSLRGVGLCVLALVVWATIIGRLYKYRCVGWGIGLLAVFQLIGSDYGIYPQCNPSEYYPRQPILSDLSQAPAGRVCGVFCFPANLPETHGLLDVRGYDAATPQRLVQLLALTQPALLRNALAQSNVLQGYFPRNFPSPITRMMSLRYLIFTGPVPQGREARFASDGYWVYEDPHCLPRVFIPRRVRVVDDPQRRLALLAQSDFKPTEVAYVESPGTNLEEPAQGEARISWEIPSHLTIDYNMATAGMIVISDLWDGGWHAKVNGVDAPVLRVNHAFRGVVVPAGKGVVQYDYIPVDFILGLEVAGIGAALVIIWFAAALWLKDPRKAVTVSPAASPSTASA